MRWVRVSLMWAHGHLRSESRGSSVAAWRSDWQHYGSVTPKSVMSLLQSESFNLMNNVSDEPSPFINLFEASGLKLSYKVKHLTIDIWHIFVICQYCQVLVKKNNQLQPSPNKFKLVPRVGDGLTLKYPGPPNPPNWTFRHEGGLPQQHPVEYLLIQPATHDLYNKMCVCYSNSKSEKLTMSS